MKVQLNQPFQVPPPRETFKPKRFGFLLACLSVACLLFSLALNFLALDRPLKPLVYEFLHQKGFTYFLSEKTSGSVQWILNSLNPVKSNSLLTLHLDIKHKNYLKILEKRNQTQQFNQTLVAKKSVTVPGRIRFEDRTIKIKLRNKGLTSDHRDTDKLSLRISTKGKGHFLGLREFAIQHPKVRNFLLEWAYLRHLRREGVLGIRYDFVNVVLNGTPKGIFALEEHFSKELLESQGRREGVILRFDQTYHNWTWATGQFGPLFNRYTSAGILPFKRKRIGRNTVLEKQFWAARKLLNDFQAGRKKASEVFDIDMTAKYLAVTELWSACHGEVFINIRFYYNPISGLLEPIGYDAEVPHLSFFESPLCSFNRTDIALRFMEDKTVAQAFEKELQRISSSESLTKTRVIQEPEYHRLYKDLKSEFPYVPSAMKVFDALEKRAFFFQQRSGPDGTGMEISHNNPDFKSLPKPPSYFTFEDKSNAASVFQVYLTNLYPQPVRFMGIDIRKDNDWQFVPASKLRSLEKRDTPLDEFWLPANGLLKPLTYLGFGVPKNFNLQLRKTTPHKLQVRAWIQTIAGEKPIKYGLSYRRFFKNQMGKPPLPTIESLLAQHPFLELKGNTLFINRGVWEVRGDLLIPKGYVLEINEGVKLRFSPDAIFLSGSPVYFQGSEQHPIVIEATNQSWGGFVALDNEISEMKHVYFRRASSINRNGWFLTGGVTFYKSDTRLDHVKIFNALGEDALNIIQSPFKLENSLIQEAVSDGFDGDFAEGTITHCVFRKIGGDGIDFSGSKVHVTFSDFEDIRDKAVSAGEGSRLDLKNIKIVRSSTGVASKDASHVEIKDSRFKEIFSAALTTYVKKTEYKAPGSINSMGSPMELVERQGYAQTGSTLIIDGSPVPTEEMDVEKLYNTGIMRK